MADQLHPTATEHLPAFITAPGQTDWLMVVVGLILIFSVLMFGVLFFRLHTLPERLAHKSQKIQFEIVAILGLISLFTHMHIFWIAGLLLAVIDLPDFGNSLTRIAGSAEKIAGIPPGEGAGLLAPDSLVGDVSAEHPPRLPQASNAGNGGTAVPIRPDAVSSNQRS